MPRLPTLVGMLESCLRLARTLNALSEGSLDAAHAEHLLRSSGGVEAPHHVADPDGLLGLDPLAQVPLRQALARVDRDGRTWALLLPRPGRMAGLRGPVALNREAVSLGAVVLPHDGGPAWLGRQVGHGVQWSVQRAERPVPPTDPREAARMFARRLAEASEALALLEHTAGDRPDPGHAPSLGGHYPATSQKLLDRAWLVLAAVDAGLEAQHEVLHSHGVLTRERHLRELADVALDAVTAAASWPSRALADGR